MRFFEYAQDQTWLFPPSLRALIKEDDFCIVINDVIERVGVREIENKYVEEGHPAYHPKMMTKIYLYAYATGIRSSRKIARELEGNIKFWYLSGKQMPDFRTISDFRKNHMEEIKILFKKVVQLCCELGMVNLGLVAIDGTKIKASASEKETKTEEGLRNELEGIDMDISRFLKEAEETDNEEDKKYGHDKRGDEVPKEIARSEDRKKKIEEALEKLKEKELKNINVTDNDAKVMRQKKGNYGPAYNCQTAVDEKQEIIIAAETFPAGVDMNLLEEVTEAAEENVGDKPEKLISDCGYHSANNIEYLEKKGIDGYIPDLSIKTIKKEKDRKTEGISFAKEAFYYDPDQDCYICPERKKLTRIKSTSDKYKNKGIVIYRQTKKECQMCKHFSVCTKSKNGRIIERNGGEALRRSMAEKVRSPEGMAIYGKRMHIAEMPFANIKQNLGFREFLLRGLNKVDGEFKMICIVHNMKMIYRHIYSKGKNAGPPGLQGLNSLDCRKDKNRHRILDKPPA
jgi:transposase